jgi:uncharacterized membrane protein
MRATLWVAVVLLVVIGVTSAIGRAIFSNDFAHRVEPIRLRLSDSQPHPEAVLAEVDNKFGGHRFITLLHVVPGGIFLLLAPIQFIPAIRNRYLRAHRWLGRVLLIAVLISGAVGLFFGVFHPIGGVREAIGIVIFGTFLFVCAIRAYIAIRRGEVALHREWMIRAFATALAISTVRVVAGTLDATRALGADSRAQFVVSIWSGWLITIAAAELWIRYTRRSTNAHRLALDHLQQEPGS